MMVHAGEGKKPKQAVSLAWLLLGLRRSSVRVQPLASLNNRLAVI